MKKVLFIGNRLNVFKALPEFDELKLVKVYVQEESLLHRELSGTPLPGNLSPRMFSIKDKKEVIEEICVQDFDILLSNGCPIILPVTKMKKDHQLFINVHPTLLPDLKGKTPLNGVFMTHRKQIGATMHYIDDGIDTGKIIAQASTDLTDDLDQGLVYRVSFGLETEAFRKGIKLLASSNYDYEGSPQQGEGSYFNRTPELQTIDMQNDPTDLIIDKVKSFGIKGQGTLLQLEAGAYRLYAAEKVINPYLIKEYADVAIGQIALEYDEKLIIKTSDGLIKVTNYELEKAT